MPKREDLGLIHLLSDWLRNESFRTRVIEAPPRERVKLFRESYGLTAKEIDAIRREDLDPLKLRVAGAILSTVPGELHAPDVWTGAPCADPCDQPGGQKGAPSWGGPSWIGVSAISPTVTSVGTETRFTITGWELTRDDKLTLMIARADGCHVLAPLDLADATTGAYGEVSLQGVATLPAVGVYSLVLKQRRPMSGDEELPNAVTGT